MADWLATALPDFGGPLLIRQFQGGQSNPTFLIEANGGKVVLRKKPPGSLLPKAHNVEREYRILAALSPTNVPIPEVMALCEDAEIIGTAFYIMQFVEGRFFDHPIMPDTTPGERRRLHRSTVEAMVRLHKVDIDSVGLCDYGPRTGFVARQVERWGKQYRASLAAGELPALTWLGDWLRERQDVAEETTITHGDFRHGNLCFGQSNDDVTAILDWELSTLGHPLSDLAYLCMPYHIEAGIAHSRGVAGLDLAELGIPEEEAIVQYYCELAERPPPSDWRIFLALSFYRLAAILHGVMARALQGNASNGDALEVAKRAGALAEIGQRIARKE
ncbi:MAG: phosphotransferase [Rhizobiaceae bacterium]|nr:phosphotransferase [Rhizobiaceae bacterium]